MKLIKAKFSVNDSPAFDGFYDPTVKWNGFYCPLFPSEVVGRIFDHFPLEPEDCENIKGVAVELSKEGYSLLFAVNNCNWCWEVENPLFSSLFENWYIQNFNKPFIQSYNKETLQGWFDNGLLVDESEKDNDLICSHSAEGLTYTAGYNHKHLIK